MKLYLPLAATYFGLVVLANWLASAYVVHVPLTPYKAPAGVFCIGMVLVLRDWIQQLHGLWWTMPLVYAAGLVTWGVGYAANWKGWQDVAIASVVAFSVSETVEAVVFTPLRNRNLTLGVVSSATIGNAIDSLIFLAIAFGSIALFWGQFWGKSEMIAVGTLLTMGRRRIAPVALTRAQ
jgi:uncharacterized PurR-regulated membrane protein YhhQ (DUF165 family)